MKYDSAYFNRLISILTFYLPRFLGVVATVSRAVNRYAVVFVVCAIVLSIYNVYSMSMNNSVVEDNQYRDTEISYFNKTTTDVSLRDYLREHFIFLGTNKQPGLGVKQAVFLEPSSDCYHAFELNRQYAFNVSTRVEDDHIECELCFDEAAHPYSIKLEHISNDHVSLVVYKKSLENGTNRVVFKDEFALKKRPTFTIDSDHFKDYASSLNRLKVYDSDVFISTFVSDDSEYPQTTMKFSFLDKQGNPYVVYNHHDLFGYVDGQWCTMKKSRSDCPMMIIEKNNRGGVDYTLWEPWTYSSINKKTSFSKEKYRFSQLSKKIALNGMRSKDEANIKIDGHDFKVKEQSWIMFNGDEWIKLNTSEQLDAFITGKQIGELIVVDKVYRNAGTWAVDLSLFSPLRSQVETLTLN